MIQAIFNLQSSIFNFLKRLGNVSPFSLFIPHFSSLIPHSLFLIAVFALSSCFKEKPLAPPGNQGIGQTAVIEMGHDYANQFFYSLETNRVVSSNSRFAYDLLFDCGNNDFYIWLNTAKLMSALRTDRTDIKETTIADTTGKHWLYELGEFNTDSNAIGAWWQALTNQPVSKGEVYIINLGLDDHENNLGYIKLQVNDFNGSSYSISYAGVNDTLIKTALIQKDATRNYRYFTFNGTGSMVDNIEPAKAEWDLCFTRYSVVFYDPYYLPYQVTGVLTNPAKVQAYLDSTVNFNEVEFLDLAQLQPRRDAIGYEWKRYELGDYITKTWYTFFIKAGEDRFYKLRFIDFKKDGIWGYPTFEYYRL
ncbi:MAG: HmuY family protein [Chitinophagales bacterium]|nr:HmuY family protein [Chitinophagales bacterium]